MATVYPQFATSDSFTFGFRGELFGVHTDLDMVDSKSVFAATLTRSYSYEKLTIKPEIRLDSWNNSSPNPNDNGDFQNSLSSVYLAAIYEF